MFNYLKTISNTDNTGKLIKAKTNYKKKSKVTQRSTKKSPISSTRIKIRNHVILIREF